MKPIMSSNDVVKVEELSELNHDNSVGLFPQCFQGHRGRVHIYLKKTKQPYRTDTDMAI